VTFLLWNPIKNRTKNLTHSPYVSFIIQVAARTAPA
jgi:hypothetical protein